MGKYEKIMKSEAIDVFMCANDANNLVQILGLTIEMKDKNEISDEIRSIHLWLKQTHTQNLHLVRQEDKTIRRV